VVIPYDSQISEFSMDSPLVEVCNIAGGVVDIVPVSCIRREEYATHASPEFGNDCHAEEEPRVIVGTDIN